MSTSISDGYHTFDELYDHRNLLFINFCIYTTFPAWWKKGEFEGYFCLYAELPGGQISYHIPDKYFYLIENTYIEHLPCGIWSGHHSNDCLDTLRMLALLDDEGLNTCEECSESLRNNKK